MRIVAVILCATGIAHMYTAAETIKKEYKKKGYACKVEIQGASGIEDKLSEKDTKTTDLTVFANDVGINKAERFDAYKDKIVRYTPHQVIQESDIILKTLK